MRHAVRLPPPPIFEDRPLVQLIAYCKLRIIDRSFGVRAFYLHSTLVYFCRYLYVLDVFCQLSVNSLRVWRRWQSANLIEQVFLKCCKNNAKILHEEWANLLQLLPHILT